MLSANIIKKPIVIFIQSFENNLWIQSEFFFHFTKISYIYSDK